MRKHSRFLALVLATTLVVTQVPTAFLPVTVKAAEMGTEQSGEDTVNIVKDVAVWNPEYYTGNSYVYSENNSVLTEKITFTDTSYYVGRINTYDLNWDDEDDEDVVKIDADRFYKLLNPVQPSEEPAQPSAEPGQNNNVQDETVEHVVSDTKYSYQWYQLKDGKYEKLQDETSYYLNYYNNIDNDVDSTVFKCVITLTSANLDGEYWYADEDDDFKIQFEYVKEYDYTGVTAEKIASGEEDLDSYFEEDCYFNDEAIDYNTTSEVVYPDSNSIYGKNNGEIKYSYVPTFRDGDTYTTEYKSGVRWNFDAEDYGLPFVIEENKTDEQTGETTSVKHYVDYYTLSIDYMYGQRVIASKIKKYIAHYNGILSSDVAKDPTILNKYFTNVDDLSGRDKIFFVNKYDDTEVTLNTECDGDYTKIKYVVNAYDADGNKDEVKNTSTSYYNPYFYADMYRDFEIYDKDGNYKGESYEQVAYYEIKTTLCYGEEELVTYTKKYDVVYSPIKVTTSEKNTFKARLNEKKMLTVEAYSAVDEDEGYIGNITYQWYKVDKDGKETIIEGETSKNIYVTVSDFTVSYKCVISATNIIDGKYKDETVEVPTVTFTPEKSAGYLLKNIENMYGSAYVGDAYKMGVECVADSDSTISYSWDKVSEKDDEAVYTPIENATSNYLVFDSMKDSDFVRVYDYNINEYVSYRLTVTIKTGEDILEQYHYYFTVSKNIKNDIEISSNMYNYSYNYVNRDIWTTVGKPVDLYVNTKINNTDFTIDSVSWYKQIKEVKYTAKKDENGEYVCNTNGSVEWDTDVEIPAKDTYQWTTVDDEEYGYVNGDYTCIAKTVYYYTKINAAENTNKYTVNGAAGDNGYYLCTLTVTETKVTDEGSSKNTDYINFKEKVCFESGIKAYAKSDRVYAAVGRKADLTVVASNSDGKVYPITYQWAKFDSEKEGKYVDIKDATSATYSVAEVKASDYGKYRVEVKDTSDNDVIYLYITLSDNVEEPVFLTARENYYNKKIGDDVKLKVDAKIPQGVNVDYTWYKSETYLKNVYDDDIEDYYYDEITDDNWQLIGQNTNEYNFKVKSDDDLTTYRCEARYKIDGNYVTKTFNYYVQDQSYISVEYASLKTQYKNIGDSATYAVKVVAGNVDANNIKYTWSRMNNNGDFEIIDGANEATYTVPSLTEKDFSSLRVEISYSDRHASEYKYFTTCMNTDVTLESDEQSIKANEGENITFKVPVINPSNKTNITYQWYSDDYGIIYGATSQEYTISSIGANEFGRYYCNVYESGYNIANYYVNVVENIDEEILDVKIADNGSSYVEKGLGESVTLKVDATSSRNNELVYQWYFNDEAIGEANEASYTIPALTKSDVGYYSCLVRSVDNKYSGNASIVSSASISFYVGVTSGLKVDNGYLYTEDFQGYKVNLGDTLTLKANATVDSDKYSIFYQWYAKGERIQGATASTLTLTNITVDDLGNYTCEVTDANYSTKTLKYYVYCDTGLYVKPSVSHPIADADGKVNMYVEATANAGENITYTWYGFDEDNNKVVLSDKSSYTVDKLLKSTIKDVYVNVSTSGESFVYFFDIGTVYNINQNRENALPGDELTFDTSMFNKIQDVEYTYTWYERDSKTNGWKKIENTQASYKTKAPEVSIEGRMVPYAVKDYMVYTYCDGEQVNSNIFSVKVYPNVTFSTTTLPESKHNMTDRFDIKGYTIPGAKEMIVSFDNLSSITECDVYIIDSEGKRTYVSANKYNVKGDKVIVVCENSNEYGLNYGYKVTSIVDPDSATVNIAGKKATYTGKAVSVAAANVTASNGKVKYTYYTDKNCTVKTTKKANGAASVGAAPVYAGTYYVKAVLEASGDYYSKTSNVAVVNISKAKQSVGGVTVAKTYKKNVVAKKSQTFILKGSSSAKTKLTYKKSVGNKKITVSKTGKVTVKKGLKKGTYKVKVKVTAASNANYKKATTTKTITVKIK